MEHPYIQYMYSYPHKMAYRALPDLEWKDYAGRLSGGKNSLYVHIPFCQYKCGYCNLFSLAGQKLQQMEAYVSAMERQALSGRRQSSPSVSPAVKPRRSSDRGGKSVDL